MRTFDLSPDPSRGELERYTPHDEPTGTPSTHAEGAKGPVRAHPPRAPWSIALTEAASRAECVRHCSTSSRWFRGRVRDQTESLCLVRSNCARRRPAARMASGGRSKLSKASGDLLSLCGTSKLSKWLPPFEERGIYRATCCSCHGCRGCHGCHGCHGTKDLRRDRTHCCRPFTPTAYYRRHDCYCHHPAAHQPPPTSRHPPPAAHRPPRVTYLVSPTRSISSPRGAPISRISTVASSSPSCCSSWRPFPRYSFCDTSC